MRKRWIAALVAVMMLFGTAVGAMAENTLDYTVVAACERDAAVSLFMEGGKQLAFANSSNGERVEPVSMADSGKTCYYLLLVDDTTSMPDYNGRNKVNTFVRQLVQGQQADAQYCLVPFSAENLRDTDLQWVSGEAVQREARALTHGRDYTNPYTAVYDIIKALEANFPGEAGDLVSLILLWDGVPYPSTWTSRQSEYDKVQKLLKESKEICFFNVSIGEAQETFKMYNGRNPAPMANNADAGTEIADYCNGLNMVTFTPRPDANMSQTRNSLEYVVFLGINSDSWSARSEADVPLYVSEGDRWALYDDGTQETTAETEPASTEPQGTDTEPGTGETEPRGTDTEPGTGETSDGRSTEFPEDDGDNETEGENDGKAEGKNGGKKAGILIAVASLLTLLILGAVLYFAVFRKKSPGQSSGSLYMKVNVLTGGLQNGQTDFYLTDTLTVGSDRRCGICFADASMAAMHLKVILKNGAVTIEDMGSVGGTLLNGNRVYTVVRVKSGDVITAGHTVFSLKF